MNIPAANSAPHIAARTPVAPPASLAGATPLAPSAPTKDELSLSPAGVQMAEHAPQQGISERVADFAARTQSRLANLARSGAVDGDQLGALSKQFAAHIDRVQAGIESGGLDFADAIRGVRNALEFVREGVSDKLTKNSAPEPTLAPSQPAVAQAPAAPAPVIDAAPQAPALDVAAQAPALDVAAQAPALDVAAQAPALDVAAPALSDPSDPRARLAGLGSQIADRLASLDRSGFSPSQNKAFSALTNSFESVFSRLDHALDKGAIGKDRLSSVIASAIDDLSAGLGNLLASQQSLSLYGPTSGDAALGTSAHLDGHA
jgi:hypothetical protein